MRVCVYCGSAPGSRPIYMEAAAALGTLLAERDIGLVYGGASVGTMGAVADAVIAAGGEAIGVIPTQLAAREIAHPGLTELHVVTDMHQRKARMAQLADGFLALPGGAGTLEELFEAWTWAQIGLHDKPIGLVDVDGFYQPLLTMVDHMVDAGFLRPSYRDMIAVNADPAVLLDGFAEYRVPDSKWGLARRTGDEQPIDVLAWIIVRDGKLLNVRTKGKAHFYLPGGKREPGESDPIGLVREISEELGVRIDPASMRLFDLIQDKADGWADGRLVRMACYWADHDGEPVPGREIAELAWIGLADAHKLAPAGLQVLQMLAGQGLVR